MDIVRIDSKKAPMPGGWYSQGFIVGSLIFTAGMTAHDPLTQQLVAPDDIVKQTRQILINMREMLKEVGSDLQHVVKVMAFISNIDEFQLFNEEYKKFFPVNPPARSTIQVGKFTGGMVVEIEAVAVVPSAR